VLASGRGQPSAMRPTRATRKILRHCIRIEAQYAPICAYKPTLWEAYLDIPSRAVGKVIRTDFHIINSWTNPQGRGMEVRSVGWRRWHG
jgi:hypothetical protein